jgi:hypothetical protein
MLMRISVFFGFNAAMKIAGQLQALHEEFRVASARLHDQITTGHRSDEDQPLRERVEYLRVRLINQAFKDAGLRRDAKGKHQSRVSKAPRD